MYPGASVTLVCLAVRAALPDTMQEARSSCVAKSSCIIAKALNPLLCMASAAGNPAEGALLVLDVNTATGELPVFDAASCCAACQSNPEASTALNPLKSTT